MAAGGGGGSGGNTVSNPVGDILNRVGSTTSSYVTVIDPVQSGGMIGIGSIENTGGFKMSVRETVKDKLGNTVSVETVVEAGDYYILDPQTSFDDLAGGLALPPFTEYKLEVKFGVDGSSTDYILRWVDVAVGSGPGSGGGPPGTWTLVDSGVASIGNSQTVNVTSKPFPVGGAVYMMLACQADSAGAGEVVQGSTLSAPPSTSVYYSLITGAGFVIMRLRSGSAVGSTTINWALYTVVP